MTRTAASGTVRTTVRTTTVDMSGGTRTCETCGQSFPPGVSHGHGSGHHPDFARDYAREWEAHPPTDRRGRRVVDLLPAQTAALLAAGNLDGPLRPAR
ncbi:hypothetical protein [Frankia sp. CiP3]|uniref:hypothetical protein n=1 Tax=Frankia sp. CiP3 TaxID=2880971 RepID=UPI001EF4E082|nr:hypothetical protein [Frankia sp. CiP3]